jgi:hypothetical protein
MSYASTVPAAIAALVSAFETSVNIGLAGVPVFDGPPLGAEQATGVVAVGYSGDEAETVVEGAASPADLGLAQDRETYSITCAAAAVDPGTSIAAARGRAYALHAACGAAVRTDPKLGGAVMRASLGIASLRQEQNTYGARVTVVFPVNCEAFTSR